MFALQGLVAQQFEKLLASGHFKEAAECAAESPGGQLRTREVSSWMSWGIGVLVDICDGRNTACTLACMPVAMAAACRPLGLR